MTTRATGPGGSVHEPALEATVPHALAYHAGGLGDFVLSIPALLRLAASRPGTRWHYWGPRDRLVLLPGWLPAPSDVLRGEASLWGGRPAAASIGWLSGAEMVVAFAAFPPPWLPPKPRGVHLQAFPGDLDAPTEWVPRFQARQLDRVGVPPVANAWLPGWRRQVLPERPGGRLVLHPGSGDRAKNLPLATWRAAVEALVREFELAPLLLEGPVEQDRDGGCGGWSVERRASSTLQELLGVLSQASVLLGSDSGVVHLAGLLGIPTVVVFGPSDPARWRPLGSRVALVSSDRACAPCSHCPPVTCDHRACLGDLPAWVVADAARRLLLPAPRPGNQETRSARR